MYKTRIIAVVLAGMIQHWLLKVGLSCQSGPVMLCKFSCSLPSRLAPPPTFQAGWSLVFLVGYLLTVFLLSPSSLSHTPAMICLSTEHASSATFLLNSLRVCGLGLAILSMLLLCVLLRTYVQLCFGTRVPRQKRGRGFTALIPG